MRDSFTHDKHLVEPQGYAEIVEDLTALTDPKTDWNKFQESHDEKFVEIKAQDNGYLPIEIEHFVVLPKSHFNVYIKIGSGNYIKIVNAGETVMKDFFDKYSSKGFTEVHLPLAEHE